jgi:hypothetical protein
MHYLDVHSGSLQVISSVVLAAITVIYTILTRTMAKAAREALRPYVYLDVFFTSPAEMYILVGNSGTKVAGDVKINLLNSSSQKLAELIEPLPFASGIGHLAPGSTRRYRLIVSPSDIFPKTGPAPTLRFKFLYHEGSRPIDDTQDIDLGGYQDSMFPWVGDPMHEIATELKDIARKIPQSRGSFLNATKLCPYCGTKLAESAKKCHSRLEWISPPSTRPRNIRSGAHIAHSRSRRARGER